MDLEEAPMFEETVREWESKLRKEGRKEGRQEGLIEGMQRVLLRQMSLRFGRLPQEVRSRVERIVSIGELEKLTRKVLRARTLQEMGLG
jgi:predicted transposase YdaD